MTRLWLWPTHSHTVQTQAGLPGPRGWGSLLRTWTSSPWWPDTPIWGVKRGAASAWRPTLCRRGWKWTGRGTKLRELWSGTSSGPLYSAGRERERKREILVELNINICTHTLMHPRLFFNSIKTFHTRRIFTWTHFFAWSDHCLHPNITVGIIMLVRLSYMMIHCPFIWLGVAGEGSYKGSGDGLWVSDKPSWSCRRAVGGRR